MQIKKNITMFLCLLSLFSVTNSQAQSTMTCVTQEFNVCESGQCRKIQNPNKSWIELGQDKLKKCDGKGCDVYETDTSRSGDFLNISIGNKGYLLKIDSGRNFVEVSTLGLLTIVKNGKCS